MAFKFIKTLFSDRNKEQHYIKDYFSDSLKLRIVGTFKDLLEKRSSDNDLEKILDNLYLEILKKYGIMLECYESKGAAVLSYFGNANVLQSLDFLELFFADPNCNFGNEGVMALNELFQDENIGFYFSPYVFESSNNSDVDFTMFFEPVILHYPIALVKAESYTHQIQEESLHLFATNSKFETVNSEFLQCLKRFKEKDFAGALTLCGSSLESMLKLICHEKKWVLKDRAVMSDLLAKCLDNNLFREYSVQCRTIIQNISNLRNGFSDAHGRQGQRFELDEKITSYAINLTASNLLLLAKLL